MVAIELKQPELLCNKSPIGAHYFTQVTVHIWRCEYCWRPKWMPFTFAEAQGVETLIRRYGRDRALKKLLGKAPAEEKFMRKLEEFRLLRKALPEDQFLSACAAIEAESKGKRLNQRKEVRNEDSSYMAT